MWYRVCANLQEGKSLATLFHMTVTHCLADIDLYSWVHPPNVYATVQVHTPDSFWSAAASIQLAPLIDKAHTSAYQNTSTYQ